MKTIFDAQSISDLLDGLTVDKNGHIRGKNRVMDQLQSLHLKSIELESDTLTAKDLDQARDDCIHFESCQGRNHCLNTEMYSSKCTGVDCGKFERKKNQHC